MMMVEVHSFLLLTKITFELSGSIKRSLYLGLLALIYWVKVPDQTTINTFTITYWKRGGWMLWLSSMMRYRIAQANAQTHLHLLPGFGKVQVIKLCLQEFEWPNNMLFCALKQMLLRKLDIMCYKVFNSFGLKGSNFHFDRFTAHSVWLQGSLIRGAWESETTTEEAIVVKNSEGRIISSNVCLS